MKIGVAILISDKIDLRAKKLQVIEGHYIIEGLIDQIKHRILNMYAQKEKKKEKGKNFENM